MKKRTLLIVMDGVGVGALPDAQAFGDAGADTLGHVAAHVGGLQLPQLRGLGLGNIHELAGISPAAAPRACWGKLMERTPGKDSTAGHWELCGVVLDKPFRTFPQGFPADFMRRFCERAGLSGCLGNKPASGTGILDELGTQHLQTKQPIVYTSADPVLQIAAHADVMSLERLYEICEIAYELAVPLGIGRVIARPFRGAPGKYERTEMRKDFSVPPPAGTLLDRLQSAGVAVHGVGKVDNLFAGRGFDSCVHTRDNLHGIEEIGRLMQSSAGASTLLFANLVDFDTMYGHRNDPKGFAEALRAFDVRLPKILAALQPQDLLLITADHGNDPLHPGSDHTREYTPILACLGSSLQAGKLGQSLGVRPSFADVGATIAEHHGVSLSNGESFLEALK